MDHLRFTIPEILSLFGLAQCLYIIIYMLFRAGRLSRAGVPLLFFFTLSLAFLFDFSEAYIKSAITYFTHWQWAAWFYGPPLAYLLIIQVAQITRVPRIYHYWVLFTIPAAYSISSFMSGDAETMDQWLAITGILAGIISMLAVWGRRGMLDTVHAQKTGKERYWLILALIIMMTGFLGIMLASMSDAVKADDARVIRTIFGLCFVYITSTTLFRIYPRAIRLEKDGASPEALTDSELELAFKIEHLMNYDKIYQEPAYSRADLARECGASEALISKVINIYFQKSFPQMMNEYRVEDAKRLLKETDAPIKVVAEETGFNALASFNRVFKDMTGLSPSDYRDKH